ncbi:MAG: alginate lyase family protein [Bacteroidales bacterium]|jgi:hypothetical protein|nr:alginate lyase family protein [Bacteroidales bacterium]MCB9029392.1 alginate lyase family protein [Bacteroidales bacterium]NLE34403.1 hypothetical protein [Bacteroidales bacterium]HOO66467.1 alginate lyase family protein [Bacteroidales bacterium]HPE22853.1 alginate lyase family protein [Bacteroidales bacterium]
MPEGRRRFIRNIFAGTAGVALGGLTINAASSDAFRRMLCSNVKNGEPVFPFLKYVTSCNFGDYIPKDQGGKFIQMTVLGSEDDEKIVSAIRNGTLAKVYGDPLEWQRYEGSELEKSVWLNRFYFLPSFARMYYLTGDRTYLDDMMRFIRQWIEDNPRLPDSHRTTFNWRDMQVAWRSIHYSWCYYLGEKGLTGEEKGLIKDTLKEHAHILLTGFGQAKLNEFNHQSHGGLAMLYLGVLFPELEDAAELRRKAMIILNHHLANAFYPDGGNVEQMFGYYPFQAHLFRDAFLLCCANGIEPPENSIPMLHKMALYLAAVVRPDGTVPQVNDSYEMPVRPILDSMNEILGVLAVDSGRPEALFDDTQVASMRISHGGGWYLLANPASVIGAHAHAGRLGFELWHRGLPLIIDSGCCNYDEPELVTWYRTTRAHNTVVIDGRTEAATSSSALWVPRRETPNRITGWNPGGEAPSIVMASPPEEVTNGSVSWRRKITIVRGCFAVISDRFDTEGEHNYEILLHFPPSEVTADQNGKSLQVKTGILTGIQAVVPAGNGVFVTGKGLVSIRGRSVEAPVASLNLRARGKITSHLLIMPSPDMESTPAVKTTTRKGITRVTVRNSTGTRTRIILSDDGVMTV